MSTDPKEWMPSSGTRPPGIFSDLRKIAPNIAFSVNWEKDPTYVWDGDGPDPAEEGYVAHDVDVYATAIVDGRIVEGRQSLGGAYDKPGELDPDVHGYLPQLLEEAVSELEEQVTGLIHEQALKAKKFLKDVLKKRYEQQSRRYKS